MEDKALHNISVRPRAHSRVQGYVTFQFINNKLAYISLNKIVFCYFALNRHGLWEVTKWSSKSAKYSKSDFQNLLVLLQVTRCVFIKNLHKLVDI
jgi:hypothetical protein